MEALMRNAATDLRDINMLHSCGLSDFADFVHVGMLTSEGNLCIPRNPEAYKAMHHYVEQQIALAMGEDYSTRPYRGMRHRDVASKRG